ncbi:MAG TPA: lactonase family protein [Bryobacteraceae bacterium]|jgi:6-phosphogluconolactonase|nr:lactonase family protein [Bryobacteraceae bacterium]
MSNIQSIAICAASLLISSPAYAAGTLVYIGTFTTGASKGIYAYRLNEDTGHMTPLGLAAAAESPSYLAVSPNRRFLYAVNEVDTYEGKKAGSISAFSIDPSNGKLTLLNKVSSGSPGPTHLAVDPSGKWLFVANYAGGSLASFPVGADGRLGTAASLLQHTGSGVDPKRQGAPHPHQVVPSPDGRFVLSPDLGLDRVFTYVLNPETGKLTDGKPPFTPVKGGSGPRHLAFGINARFVYLACEMASDVIVFTYTDGTLQTLQTISILPKGFSGQSTAAEIAVHPNGRFLYASNRGADDIAQLNIDQATGLLTYGASTPTQGKEPRGFGIDPQGKYLFAANQNSDTVVPFHIDPNTGKLSPLGETLSVPSPVCVVFVQP